MIWKGNIMKKKIKITSPSYDGITLRDYFAGQSIIGLIIREIANWIKDWNDPKDRSRTIRYIYLQHRRKRRAAL